MCVIPSAPWGVQLHLNDVQVRNPNGYIINAARRASASKETTNLLSFQHLAGLYVRLHELRFRYLCPSRTNYRSTLSLHNIQDHHERD